LNDDLVLYGANVAHGLWMVLVMDTALQNNTVNLQSLL